MSALFIALHHAEHISYVNSLLGDDAPVSGGGGQLGVQTVCVQDVSGCRAQPQPGGRGKDKTHRDRDRETHRHKINLTISMS